MNLPIIPFIAFQVILFGGIILYLRHVFVSGTDEVKQRLERDAESARAREAELNRKIRQADEELSQRRKELDALEQKMKTQLEADAVKHKEELVGKARADAEEIISKAQNAAEGVRRDIVKSMEMKIIDYSIKILDEVLTQKAKAALEADLTAEFIVQLKNVDMSKISSEIRQAELVTAHGLGPSDVKAVEEIIRSKTGRAMTISTKAELGHISGVVLRFGSLHLDGSLKTAIRDQAISLKTEIEKGYQDKK